MRIAIDAFHAQYPASGVARYARSLIAAMAAEADCGEIILFYNRFRGNGDLSESFEQRRVVRPKAALELLEMHRSRRYELGHRIWQIAMFEVWARVWLDRLESQELMAESISTGFS